MKTFLFFLLLIGTGYGQSLNVSVFPSALPPNGGTATLALTFTDAAPTANIAGFQWSFNLPAGVTAGTPIASTLDTTLVKVINCSAAPGGPCLIAGTVTLNVTPYTSGVIAAIPLTVAPGATGALTISANVLASSAAGVNVPITSTPAILTVFSRYDLDGDGKVDAADVQIALNQAVGKVACSSGDVNGDGACNIHDVLLVILAAMGAIR